MSTCSTANLMTGNLAFLYNDGHIDSSLAPRAFASATVVTKERGHMYSIVFIGDGNVLLEDFGSYGETFAYQGVGDKLSEMVSEAAKKYPRVSAIRHPGQLATP